MQAICGPIGVLQSNDDGALEARLGSVELPPDSRAPRARARMTINASTGRRSVTRTTAAVAVLSLAAVILSALLGSARSAAGAAGGEPVHGTAARTQQADVSSNWAGYVATGPGSTATTASPAMAYTDVTGQWVEPKALCVPGSPTSVAIWVGLGGYSETSQELEQTGPRPIAARTGPRATTSGTSSCRPTRST